MRDVRLLKATVFVNALVPAAMIGTWAATGGLGANPVDFFTRATGTLTLIFLLLTLAVTPVRKLTGAQWLGKLRRMLGLFAFFYAALHFVAYVWLDQFFALSAIVGDIFQRPFVAVGMASFGLMVTLAVTSTNGAIKRLGGKRWQQIHRRMYLLSVLGVLHYILLVKADLQTPVIYAGLLAALLGYRLVAAMRGGRKSRPPVAEVPEKRAG